MDGKLNLIYYGLLASDYPSDLEIRQIYKDLDLEENIIKHMINVMNIAKIIAGHMKEKGYKLDLDLLRAAALLHDIKRKEKRHEIKSANYVEKLGYPKTAKLIASHNDYRENVDRITESDILYLADKYSLEDNFVSIDERFNRSLAKCKTEEALYFHNKRYEFAKKIEEIIKLKAGLDYKTICKELNKDYEKFIGKGN